MTCVYAVYQQQRDCYGRPEVTDAGFDCFNEYNERLMEISKRSATASTRAVAVSICRYFLHVQYINFVCPYLSVLMHGPLSPADNNRVLAL